MKHALFEAHVLSLGFLSLVCSGMLDCIIAFGLAAVSNLVQCCKPAHLFEQPSDLISTTASSQHHPCICFTMLLSTPQFAFQLLCHAHIIQFTPSWPSRQRAHRAAASLGSHTHGSHQGDHAALPGAGPHACPQPDERHGGRLHPWHDDWPDLGRHRPFPGASPKAYLCQMQRANCNEF